MEKCLCPRRFLLNFHNINIKANVNTKLLDLWAGQIRHDFSKRVEPNFNFDALDVDTFIKSKGYNVEVESWLKELLKRNLENNFDKDILKLCILYSIRLLDQGLIPIFHDGDLANKIGVSKKYLYWLAKVPKKQYRVYSIKKTSGGYRKITAPKIGIKIIQKWILRQILEKVSLHDNCEGFRLGRSIVTNCRRHTNKQIILKFDIKDFFPSINFKRVLGMFLSLGYVFNLSYLLAKLTTYNNELPQGLPTSPAIANIILKRLDSRLTGLAKKTKANYSRYADDITFSGNDRSLLKVILLIKKVVQEEGFRLASRKVGIYRKGIQQKVTGLIVNKKISVPRTRIRMLRAVLHNCSLFGLNSQREKWKNTFNIKKHFTEDDFVKVLKGNIAFVRMVDPSLAKKLVNIYKSRED